MKIISAFLLCSIAVSPLVQGANTVTFTCPEASIIQSQINSMSWKGDTTQPGKVWHKQLNYTQDGAKFEGYISTTIVDIRDMSLTFDTVNHLGCIYKMKDVRDEIVGNMYPDKKRLSMKIVNYKECKPIAGTMFECPQQ